MFLILGPVWSVSHETVTGSKRGPKLPNSKPSSTISIRTGPPSSIYFVPTRRASQAEYSSGNWDVNLPARTTLSREKWYSKYNGRYISWPPMVKVQIPLSSARAIPHHAKREKNTYHFISRSNLSWEPSF